MQLALLTAIELIMAFTPLGYLKIGPVSITFMAIPVAVGAIVLGPISGAFFGLGVRSDKLFPVFRRRHIRYDAA